MRVKRDVAHCLMFIGGNINRPMMFSVTKQQSQFSVEEIANMLKTKGAPFKKIIPLHDQQHEKIRVIQFKLVDNDSDEFNAVLLIDEPHKCGMEDWMPYPAAIVSAIDMEDD